MASIRELSPSRSLREGEKPGQVPTVLWRSRLREASFKGAPFHVEQQGRTSGRRTVLHEYPKRDLPYAEDLGKHARRYNITGYVLQKFHAPDGSAFNINYDIARDQLVAALESFGPGTLIDPYNNRIGPMLYQCERYSMSETRERGGIATFEMQFVEAGEAAGMGALMANNSAVTDAANQATEAAAATLIKIQQGMKDPSDPSGGIPGFSPA